MSTQKRPIFGSIAGFVIVLLLAGMLYAPTALANAQTDDKGKGDTKGKGDDKGKGNGDEKDNDNKCGVKHKYDGTCDNKKPDVDITNIHVNENTGVVTIKGNAKDNPGGSGIKNVKVSVDGKHITIVSSSAGPWTFTETLKKGHHSVMAQATDNAHNFARAHASFTVG